MASRSALAFALTSFLLTACGGSSPPPQTGPGYVPQGSSGPLFYRLPFNGTWRVARTHYDLKNDQGFGLDLVVDAPMPRSGRNEDHPSYNQPIVADAAGVVVIAVDGVRSTPLTFAISLDRTGVWPWAMAGSSSQIRSSVSIQIAAYRMKLIHLYGMVRATGYLCNVRYTSMYAVTELGFLHYVK